MNISKASFIIAFGVVVSGFANAYAFNGVFPELSTTFTKDGNNGTVSCREFCGGAQWGPVGEAVSGRLLNFPCWQSTGYLNGFENTCSCAGSDGIFDKHGNDGSVSCDMFCGGPQWGPVGSCIASNIYQVPVDMAPGYIANGSELACDCRSSWIW
jgi:hypothetical protein